MANDAKTSPTVEDSTPSMVTKRQLNFSDRRPATGLEKSKRKYAKELIQAERQQKVIISHKKCSNSQFKPSFIKEKTNKE